MTSGSLAASAAVEDVRGSWTVPDGLASTANGCTVAQDHAGPMRRCAGPLNREGARRSGAGLGALPAPTTTLLVKVSAACVAVHDTVSPFQKPAVRGEIEPASLPLIFHAIWAVPCPTKRQVRSSLARAGLGEMTTFSWRRRLLRSSAGPTLVARICAARARATKADICERCLFIVLHQGRCQGAPARRSGLPPLLRRQDVRYGEKVWGPFCCLISFSLPTLGFRPEGELQILLPRWMHTTT
jgi:hypothetical protein